jgi:ATP-dependent helicase Lhr and Lhr-like helicase
VVNDTFATLRRGIETGFKASDPIASLPKAPGRRRPGGRAAFSRWKASLPFPGNWLRVSKPSTGDDLIDREERKKDRVRLLLDRYGILFREILQNELPPFRWSGLFRTLRLMELSGEVLTGYFFEGIPGPQFVSHDAFRLLRREPPGDAVFWMSASDPASLCGIRLYALKGKLPRRLPGTHLVYCAKKLVLVSRGNGSTLFFRVPPEDPRLQEYLGVFGHLLTREFQPLRRIVVETINNGRAAASPFVPAFRQGFDVSLDYNKVVLYRSH